MCEWPEALPELLPPIVRAQDLPSCLSPSMTALTPRPPPHKHTHAVPAPPPAPGSPLDLGRCGVSQAQASE